MNCFLFALFLVAAPLASASYGSASGGDGGGAAHISSSSSSDLQEFMQAAAEGAFQAGSTISSANGGGISGGSGSAAELTQLSSVQAELEALNSNTAFGSLKSTDAISESLAGSGLASNIRQGNINIVSPNAVNQGVYRSLLVPSSKSENQVITTHPLPPIIVNQPASAPHSIGGGPAAIVKAAPVVYKIKPSVIYQQEVINKVPAPLSLNPVYVKVYKSGKKVDAPAPSAPSYGGAIGAPAPAY